MGENSEINLMFSLVCVCVCVCVCARARTRASVCVQVTYFLPACLYNSFFTPKWQDMFHYGSFHFSYFSPRLDVLLICIFMDLFQENLLSYLQHIFFRFIAWFIRWLPVSYIHTFSTMNFFFRATPWHMEIPRLGVESELELPAYATATATATLDWS